MKRAVEKISVQKIKIMVFGTFDIVHKGHEHMFKQARSLAIKGAEPLLIVSVARDKNVYRIKNRKPRNSEQKRMEQVAAVPLVDKVVLGGVNNYLTHILKESPDIIALGYDQTAYVANLSKDLRMAGLKAKIIRLKPYKPNIYKTSIIHSK